MELLGYIVSCDSISMDQKKIQAVLEWATPKLVRDVQCFLGFAKFYWIFIKNYSKIATPLTWLTCKDNLDWNFDAEKAFQLLKIAFTIALILVHLDFSKPFFMETNPSDCSWSSLVATWRWRKTTFSCFSLSEVQCSRNQLQDS